MDWGFIDGLDGGEMNVTSGMGTVASLTERSFPKSIESFSFPRYSSSALVYFLKEVTIPREPFTNPLFVDRFVRSIT